MKYEYFNDNLFFKKTKTFIQNEYEGLTFNCACIPYSAGADSQYVDILT